MSFSKSVFIIVSLLLGSLSALNQVEIQLIKAHPNSTHPELSTIDLTRLDDPVHWLQRVHWSISDPAIEKFKIERKRGERNIFFGKPEKDFSRDLELRTHFPKGDDWHYAIIWKQQGDPTEYKFDPIIPIKPGLGGFLPWLIAIVLALFGFFGFRRYFVKKT